jgi:hypothetical protein
LTVIRKPILRPGIYRTILITTLLVSGLLVLQTTSAQQVAPQATGQLEHMSPIALPSPHYQADFTPVIANGYHAVSWSNGYLASFDVGEMKEPVALYDKSGNWLFANPVTVEGALHVYAQDAVATKSGTVIVAASATNSNGAVADMIVEIGKQGTLHVIQTSPFYVNKICTMDDGSVWAYGHELSDDRRL